MILKFFNKDGNIYLDSDKAELINITNDFRTKLLDKDYMTSDKFKFRDGIYFLRKDFFIKMGKAQNRQSIESLLIDYNNSKIIIVGDKTIVFYNNYPVNITEYDEINESRGLEVASNMNMT